MIRQVSKTEANQPQTLTRIIKKHERKKLLTLALVKLMRDTPLVPDTFQRHARRYYVTRKLGSRLILCHPYTDIHGRYIKCVVLDFSSYKKDGYVHVRPFQPVKENHYGLTSVDYTFWIHAKSHRALYKKLLNHKLL